MKRFIGIVALVTLVITGCQPITAQPMSSTTTGDLQLANAMSAAPIAVAKHATILGYDTDGMPTVVLRAGDNGWTCIVDAPVSPGNDPICLDATFMIWNEALMTGQEPQIKDVGIAYRLAGGSDPSNTDPFSTAPAAGAAWITTPPHVMILSPSGFDAKLYATQPSANGPYIRWDGTPYEYLIQPVLPIEQAVLISTLDDPTAQEVMLAEQQLNYAADFLHDVDTARPMLADDYTEKASGSRLVKEEKLSWIKSADYMGQHAKFANPSVKIEGDTATITFTLEATGTYKGSPYNSGASQVTNVWVKRNGRWQMLNGG